MIRTHCTKKFTSIKYYISQNYVSFPPKHFIRASVQNGEAIPITWVKHAESERTVYWNADGTEIVLNTGKTYIALVPDDVWSKLVLK